MFGLTKQEKNGNMILNLCFSTSHLLALQRCKNIYYMIILDVLFLYSVMQLFDSSLKHITSLFLHVNELVNIQMTPQKTGTWKEYNMNICTVFLHAHDWIFLIEGGFRVVRSSV